MIEAAAATIKANIFEKTIQGAKKLGKIQENKNGLYRSETLFCGSLSGN